MQVRRSSSLTRRDSPPSPLVHEPLGASPVARAEPVTRRLTGEVSGQQHELEEHLREALGTLAQAMHAAQASAFCQVRSQLAQLAGENRMLREQLGQGATLPSAMPPTPPAHSWVPTPMSPAGECAVLDDVQAFSKPPQPAFDRLPDVGICAETLPGQILDNPAGKLQRQPTRCNPHLDSTAHDGQAPQLQNARDRETQQRRRVTNVLHNNKRMSAQNLLGNDDLTHGKSKRSRLFPDKTELMEKVQRNLFKPEYKVTNFYHAEGVAQQIAKSSVFESMTLFVIVLNSIWIAIDTDMNTDPLDPPLFFLVVDNLFCAFFFVELLVRFVAFQSKWNCWRDAWFVFDSVLVTAAVLETWVMVLVGLLTGVTVASLTGRSSSMLRLLRMARLARTARMARLLRSVPAIMIMFKGMLVASHAVICTIFLLTIIIYVFALCLRQLTIDSAVGQSHFPSVPFSMGTLLLRGTLPDVSDLVYDLSDAHLLLGTIGLCFVLVTVLVVLNILAGVLVNVVQIVADLEKEEADASFVRNSLPVILDLGDIDGDQTISKMEFDQLLVNPQAIHLLEQVNVDIMGLVELSDFIFMNNKEYLNFEDFFKLLLKLRGSNGATVKDIVEMRKFIIQEIGSLENYLGGMLRQIMAFTGCQSPIHLPTDAPERSAGQRSGLDD